MLDLMQKNDYLDEDGLDSARGAGLERAGLEEGALPQAVLPDDERPIDDFDNGRPFECARPSLASSLRKAAVTIGEAGSEE